MNRNVLVDGNNLLHRSHAVFVKDRPEVDQMVSPSGYPTGLIYGVFSMLSDWVGSMHDPTRMVFFLDGRPKRRLAIDPDYKYKEDHETPGRSDARISLSDGYEASSEMDVILHLMSLIDVDVVHHPDEEADDMIASFVRSKSDDINIIVSPDRDFYQLLSWSDRIVLYRPGVKSNRFFDAEKAEEDLLKKFKVRVPPSNVRMFKALTGDSSDGIVGVPRLRKKVAAPLCVHDCVDDLYASGLPGFSKKEKEKALELKDRIRDNYDLIGLHDDLDVDGATERSDPDFGAAAKILREDLGIHSVLAHSFQFRRQGTVRYSQSSYDLLPDFLKDI